MTIIEAANLHKTFKLYDSSSHRLKEIMFRREYHRSFEALKGVSFAVEAGETLGIIGQNGAGKSTVLKILLGVIFPDSGAVHIGGRITGLLELGTGFNAEFSGLRNIHMNGTLLGMSSREIQAKVDEIVSFTELGDFINEPIKTYSTGMVMRLAFSIAIHADPQAFVVDEALSVGDAYFQQKCINKIKEFKRQGGAIVFVSHDMSAVKVLCQRAMLLDYGETVVEGNPEEVINHYNYLLAKKSREDEIRFGDPGGRGKGGFGNYKARVTGVRMLDDRAAEADVFVSGRPCRIVIQLRAETEVDELTVGILIRDRFGQDVFGTNTHHLGATMRMSPGRESTVEYCFDELNLGAGKYTLTVAAHTADAHVDQCYQWIDSIKSFQVVPGGDFLFVGFSRLKPVVRVG